MPIDRDAHHLHPGQHPHQRLLDVVVQLVLAHLGQRLGDQGSQAAQDQGQPHGGQGGGVELAAGPRSFLVRFVEEQDALALAPGAVVDDDAEEA